MKLQLQWQDGVPAKTLASEAELDGALQELASNAKAAGQPILVGLEAENGNSLSIALGGEETVRSSAAPMRTRRIELVVGRKKRSTPCSSAIPWVCTVLRYLAGSSSLWSKACGAQ